MMVVGYGNLSDVEIQLSARGFHSVGSIMVAVAMRTAHGIGTQVTGQLESGHAPVLIRIKDY